MSDPLSAWLASQRDLIDRWLTAPQGSAASADAAQNHVQSEIERWWQGIAQNASPQARALAQQLLELGPSFLAGANEGLFELFGASPNSANASDPAANHSVRWTHLAPIGYFREHQALAQEFANALEEYQRVVSQMTAAIARIHAEALELLATKTQTLSAAGDMVADTRQLYALWIECGEQAFAQQALADSFGRLQGELVNAGIRVRIAQQAIAEQLLKALDLPTRSELNSLHKRVREMRDRIEQLEAGPTASRTKE